MAKPSLPTRPPIVTIMGHVDHGKTTLLDSIRQQNVAQSEHGGITQHIGAYQISLNNQLITFIDTPGHAAFANMRQRGAQVTDIVVLVVAANDGIKPQTVESIQLIHQAKVPVIVAINKIDLPEASSEMVKAQLTEHQIFCEGYGGQVPAVEVSALKNTGISDLLELIQLTAELEELTADPQAPVQAVVIESSLDPHKGPLATIIVQQGTLKPGQTLFFDQHAFKVKSLTDEYHHQVAAAPPGKPVEIMGCKTVPPVGTILTQIKPEVSSIKTDTLPLPLSPTVNDPQRINIILKADTLGTLEAIRNSLSQEVFLIDQQAGPVNESDILLAQTTSSTIYAFNTKITPSAKKLAQIEHIPLRSFKIIYKLLEDIEQRVLKLIEPTIDEEELGSAEILAIFPINQNRIAGINVKTGVIDKKYPIHLIRDDNIIADSHIKSIQKGKESVDSIKAGNECGVLFKDARLDFKIGDVIKSYKKTKTDEIFLE